MRKDTIRIVAGFTLLFFTIQTPIALAQSLAGSETKQEVKSGARHRPPHRAISAARDRRRLRAAPAPVRATPALPQTSRGISTSLVSIIAVGALAVATAVVAGSHKSSSLGQQQ